MHLHRGDLVAARTHLTRALEQPWTPRDSERGGLVASLADLDQLESREDEARSGYRDAVAILQDAGRPATVACVQIDLGRLELAAGQVAAARAHHDAATRVWREVAVPELGGRVLELRGALLAHDGDQASALESLEAASELLGAAGLRLELARVLATRAEVAGTPEALAEARGLADTIGMGPGSPVRLRLAALSAPWSP